MFGGRRRFGCFGFNQHLEIDNFTGPVAAVLAGPAVVDELDRDGVKIQFGFAANFFQNEQLGLFEDSKVFQDHDSADIEMFTDVLHAAARLIAHDIEYGSTSTTSKGVKN